MAVDPTRSSKAGEGLTDLSQLRPFYCHVNQSWMQIASSEFSYFLLICISRLYGQILRQLPLFPGNVENLFQILPVDGGIDGSFLRMDGQINRQIDKGRIQTKRIVLLNSLRDKTLKISQFQVTMQRIPISEIYITLHDSVTNNGSICLYFLKI